MKYLSDKKRIASIAVALCMIFTSVVAFAEEPAQVISTTNAGITASLELGYYTEKATLNGDQAKVQENQTPVVKAAFYGYNNLGICLCDDAVNIRCDASEDAELVGSLPANAGCEVIETVGDWTHIVSGEVDGYVMSSFLVTGDAAKEMAESVKVLMATVTADSLKVREEPSTDADVITMVAGGRKLEVLEDGDEWVQVLCGDKVGFVSKEFVTLATELKDALTIEEVKYGEGVSNVRIDLVNYALSALGTPYVWGGTSMTYGADCSGLVLSVYAKYGIGLPHSAAAQANYGVEVDPSEAQPGDLFFYGGGYISHVAIYIGNGMVVHAYDDGYGVITTSAYYRTPTCVRSLL